MAASPGKNGSGLEASGRAIRTKDHSLPLGVHLSSHSVECRYSPPPYVGNVEQECPKYLNITATFRHFFQIFSPLSCSTPQGASILIKKNHVTLKNNMF